MDKILNILVDRIGDTNKQIRDGCEVSLVQLSNNQQIGTKY